MNTLVVQQLIRGKTIQLSAAKGAEDVADVGAKPISGKDTRKIKQKLNIVTEEEEEEEVLSKMAQVR